MKIVGGTKILIENKKACAFCYGFLLRREHTIKGEEPNMLIKKN